MPRKPNLRSSVCGTGVVQSSQTELRRYRSPCFVHAWSAQAQALHHLGFLDANCVCLWWHKGFLEKHRGRLIQIMKVRFKDVLYTSSSLGHCQARLPALKWNTPRCGQPSQAQLVFQRIGTGQTRPSCYVVVHLMNSGGRNISSKCFPDILGVLNKCSGNARCHRCHRQCQVRRHAGMRNVT